MNHKVLLADDSLTIQKVIKITLAQQPYDITDASSEEELFRKLPELKPKLVFLDFNLSEKFTGYELTTKIKSIVPTAKVLLLLGTFDTVDEAAMEKCGASDKIVKPFDSNKFISVCRQLIDTFVSDVDLEYPVPTKKEEKTEAPSVTMSNPEDQWTVNNAAQIEKTPEPMVEKTLDNSFPQINALEQGLSEWSMSVPGVINDSKAHDKKIDLPPVIGDKKPAVVEPTTAPVAAKTSDRPEAQVKLPDNDDLEYPDMGSFEHTPDDLPASAPDIASKKPKYVSLDEFAPIEMSNEDSTGEFVIDHSFSSDDSNVKEIEEAIRDEVAADLWHVDEFEDLKKEVSTKIEEVQSNFQPTRNDFDDSLFGDTTEDDRNTIKWNESTNNAFTAAQKPAFNTDELRMEMEAMVKKYVQEYMDQMFQKNVEKVSWEVIPDLAENLIRQELGKISNKILNDK